LTGVHFVRKGISILNKDYGSEALFNPLTLLLNGGYDITQLQSVSNKIDNPNFGRMLKNVLGNLGDPFPRIRKYGTWKFFRQELLPLGFGSDNMQWAPNYKQHLIGCGMLYTEMKECYEDKNFPAFFMIGTIHFLLLLSLVVLKSISVLSMFILVSLISIISPLVSGQL
jgi:hypothetical protein